MSNFPTATGEILPVRTPARTPILGRAHLQAIRYHLHGLADLSADLANDVSVRDEYDAALAKLWEAHDSVYSLFMLTLPEF